MDDRKTVMGIAFVGAAFGVSNSLRQPGFLELPVWRALLKLLLSGIDSVVLCAALYLIGSWAEERFVGEEDSGPAKILKRAGILAVWVFIAALAVSYTIR